MSISFATDLEFEYRRCDAVSPLIRRVVAENPGPFTLHGTGTYIVGHGQVAVIDPGPALQEHVDALLHALRGETVTHLMVTHTHMDHSPACKALQAATGAQTYGYGPHGAGKREQGVAVEEGGDMAFVPDVTLRDGDCVEGPGWTLESVYTPGHTSNHLCFALPQEGVLFTGDHVMGWSTSVISPPDGDMSDYVASLQRLLEREDRRYWPTHGPSITEPHSWVRGFIEHRTHREQQILACLADGCDTIDAMVPIMYRGLDRRLFPAAARSVYAAVLHLHERELLSCDGAPVLQSRYWLPRPH